MAVADGFHGHAANAPCDRVISTCRVLQVPEEAEITQGGPRRINLAGGGEGTWWTSPPPAVTHGTPNG